MERFINKGYFGDYNEGEKIIISEMITSLNSIYKDRWSFRFLDLHSFPQILIYFPEFTIKNSSGDTHKILDLYVVLKPVLCSNGPNFGNSIYGFRTTLTDKEYSSGYIHSHIISTDVYFEHFSLNDYAYKSFCLGSSEVIDIMQILNNSSSFDKNMFELLLLTLDTYVKWESLEGGPYIRMSTIDFDRSGSSHIFVPTQHKEDAIYLIERSINVRKNWEYVHNNGTIKVVYSDDFVNSLKKLFMDNNYTHLFCTKKGDRYYYLSDSGYNIPRVLSKYILFRGTEKYLKIKNTLVRNMKSNINIEALEIHPTLLDIIENDISKKITKKYIEYYAKKRRIEAAKRGISSYHLQRGNNQEDTVPVFNIEFC